LSDPDIVMDELNASTTGFKISLGKYKLQKKFK